MQPFVESGVNHNTNPNLQKIEIKLKKKKLYSKKITELCVFIKTLSNLIKKNLRSFMDKYR